MVVYVRKRMGVGVGKLSLLSTTDLAVLAESNGKCKKHVCWRSNATPFRHRKPTSWSVLCVFMLVVLGFISLLTGHMASDLEWYSQRLVRRTLYSSVVRHFSPSLSLSFSLFRFRCNRNMRGSDVNVLLGGELSRANRCLEIAVF